MSVQIKQVERIGRKWQQLLRLNDWEVEFLVEQPSRNEWVGECQYDLNNRRAVIRISPHCEDVTATVKHELLHVMFATFYAKPTPVLEHHIIYTLENLLGVKA